MPISEGDLMARDSQGKAWPIFVQELLAVDFGNDGADSDDL
jgi:hypothetical protein